MDSLDIFTLPKVTPQISQESYTPLLISKTTDLPVYLRNNQIELTNLWHLTLNFTINFEVY